MTTWKTGRRELDAADFAAAWPCYPNGGCIDLPIAAPPYRLCREGKDRK